MATLLCCMSSNSKDNKVSKHAKHQKVAPEEGRAEPVVEIVIHEASADNVVQAESTTNLHAGAERDGSNNNGSPPARSISNLDVLNREDLARASSNSQVLMT